MSPSAFHRTENVPRPPKKSPLGAYLWHGRLNTSCRSGPRVALAAYDVIIFIYCVWLKKSSNRVVVIFPLRRIDTYRWRARAMRAPSDARFGAQVRAAWAREVSAARSGTALVFLAPPTPRTATSSLRARFRQGMDDALAAGPQRLLRRYRHDAAQRAQGRARGVAHKHPRWMEVWGRPRIDTVGGF